MSHYLCVSLSFYPGQKIECCGSFLDLKSNNILRIRPIDLPKTPLQVGDTFEARLLDHSIREHDSFVIADSFKVTGKINYYEIADLLPQSLFIDSVDQINPHTSKVILPISRYEIYRAVGSRSPKIRFWDKMMIDAVLPFKGVDLSHRSFSEVFLLIGNSSNLQINLGVGLLHKF